MSDEMLNEAIDHVRALAGAVIWMSGSSDFGPDGVAGKHWPVEREKLNDALSFLERQDARNATEESSNA